MSFKSMKLGAIVKVAPFFRVKSFLTEVAKNK